MNKTPSGLKMSPEEFRINDTCLYCGKSDEFFKEGRCESCLSIDYKTCNICEIVLREGEFKFYSYDIREKFRHNINMKPAKKPVIEFVCLRTYDKLLSDTLCNECINWESQISEICTKCDNDFYNSKEHYKNHGNVCGHCVVKNNIEIFMSKQETEKKFGEPLIEYSFDEVQHIHSFLNRPLFGTSTVLGVLAKPLTWWASGLACEKLGWINKGNAKKGWTPKGDRLLSAGGMKTKIESMSTQEYLDLLDDAYKAHSIKLDSTAKDGTDLHAELERFVKNHMDGKPIIKTDYEEKIHKFIDWTHREVDKFIWSEIHCYSDRMWVGGISDVGVKLNNGQVGVLDFKSSKDSYDSQFIQCAGYDIQISENGGYTKEGYRVFTLEDKISFYAVVPFGAEEFTVDFRYNVDELKKAFQACVYLYKLLNK